MNFINRHEPNSIWNKDAPAFALQWHITDECDQRCKHCYIYSGTSEYVPKRMMWQDMTTVIGNAIDFCRTYGFKPVFFITGGDPMLHPEFWRLAEKLHEIGIRFVIMGNPYHLNVRVCKRLVRLGCGRFQVSLDGLEETHDHLRRPGSFKATIEAIKILKKAKLKSAVMTTVSSVNIDQMPEIIDAVVDARADVFSFARYCSTGASGFPDVTPEAYREMLSQCNQRIRKHLTEGCTTRFDKKDHLWTLFDYENDAFELKPGDWSGVIRSGCNCGISHLTILPDGEVMACRRVPGSVVGNALKDKLAEIWNEPMNAYRKYDKFQRCANCKLLTICRGCPAVAAAKHGDFYAPDPQCWRVVEKVSTSRDGE